MKPHSTKKRHFDGEIFDSDGEDHLQYDSNCSYSDISLSDGEDELLDKYDIKSMKTSRSFKNPADALLSNPKYKGKKTDVSQLELPEISNYFGSSQEIDEYETEDEEDGLEENSEDIFKAFKSIKSDVSSSINKLAIMSKQSDDTEKALHLRHQLAFLDDLFSLRIMLQKPFMKIACENETVLQLILELISVFLDIIGTSQADRKFPKIGKLWEYIKNLVESNEALLLSSYDSWWSKSHLSSHGKDEKNLHVLNQGFSASIAYAMNTFKFSGESSTHGEDIKFYQRLLKDIIDAKLSSSKNANTAILSVADINAKKHKRDAKASKGRLLSYEPHPKLENFMAPQPMRTGWNDEKINQLFNSLPTLSS